jgi:hypothetical protein
MILEAYNFSDDFQDAILACLIRHPDKFWRFGEIIKPEYFNGPSAVEVVFRLKDHVAKYGTYPNFTTLGNFVFVKTERKNPERAKELIEYVVKLSQVDCADVDTILDLSLKFAKERAIFDALRKIHLAQQEGKQDTVEPVEVMEEALRVGEDVQKYPSRSALDLLELAIPPDHYLLGNGLVNRGGICCTWAELDWEKPAVRSSRRFCGVAGVPPLASIQAARYGFYTSKPRTTIL